MEDDDDNDDDDDDDDDDNDDDDDDEGLHAIREPRSALYIHTPHTHTHTDHAAVIRIYTDRLGADENSINADYYRPCTLYTCINTAA